MFEVVFVFASTGKSQGKLQENGRLKLFETEAEAVSYMEESGYNKNQYRVVQRCKVCDSFGCCPATEQHTYDEGCLLSR